MYEQSLRLRLVIYTILIEPNLPNSYGLGKNNKSKWSEEIEQNQIRTQMPQLMLSQRNTSSLAN